MSKPKVLITGIEGSAASYLAEHLVNFYEVHGTSRRMYNHDKYTIHQCDLTDFAATRTMLEAVNPRYIYHLASNADVKMSFTNPISVLNNNINSTAVLLETLRMLGQNPVFQMCSTSEVYGNVKTAPITEDFPLNPANIYAVSKLTQEKLARFYWEAYGLSVVITRAFGYINPRRKNIFSTAFAIQIARIEAGLQEPVIRHGNLDSIRTLLDVTEIAENYQLLTLFGDVGTPYNVGSEQPIKVGDILRGLVGMSKLDIRLEENPALLRPNDVTLQIPSCAKFRLLLERKKLTRNKPPITLDESLHNLLEYCRKHYAK